ncbi:MAG: hypothetical protein CME62_16750 [Halobacteriovoraceae bacterium]|nr:hypothetical protein [Halobacteriovoraceae bacterium]|tara:strand:+ start:9980 stop:10222 length:243 start_codon:yes stop_codon:yes gene_type:complete
MDSKDEELLLEAREILTRSNTSNAEDELICECCSVSLFDIREFVNGNNGYLDLNQLREELKLGSGCSSCLKSFDSWKKKV